MRVNAAPKKLFRNLQNSARKKLLGAIFFVSILIGAACLFITLRAHETFRENVLSATLTRLSLEPGTSVNKVSLTLSYITALQAYLKSPGPIENFAGNEAVLDQLRTQITSSETDPQNWRAPVLKTLAGFLYLDSYHLPEAEDSFSQVVESPWAGEEKILRVYAEWGLAYRELLAGRVPESQKHLDVAFEFLPQGRTFEGVGLRTVRGWDFIRGGNPEAACGAFRNALETLNGGSPGGEDAETWARFYIYLGLVKCNKLQSHDSESIHFSELAAKLPLEHYTAELLLLDIVRGWAYWDGKRPEDACRSFRSGLNVASGIKKPSIKLANFYSNIFEGLSYCDPAQYNFKEAIEILNVALPYIPREMTSTLVNTHLKLADLYANRQELEQGLRETATALDLNPDVEQKLQIYLKRGQIHVDLREPSLARVDYQNALDLKADSREKVSAYTGLLKLLPDSDVERRTDYANRVLELAPKTSPDFLDFSRLIFLLQLKKRYAANPDHAQLLTLIKDLKLFSREDEEVLLTKEAWSFLNSSYDKLNLAISDRSSARPYFSDSRSNFDHFFWALYFYHKRNFTDSKAEFQTMLDTNPSSVSSLAGLENVAVEQSRYVDGLRAYIKAKRVVGLRWYSSLQTPLQQASDKIMASMNPTEFSAIVNVLAATVPEYRNVIFAALGHSYLVHDKLDESKEAFEKARREATWRSAHPEYAYIGLGAVACKQGNVIEASKNFKLALDAGGDQFQTYQYMLDCYRKKDSAKLHETFLTIGNSAHRQTKTSIFGEIPDDVNSAMYSEANLELGKSAEAEGHTLEAQRYFNEVIRLNVAKDSALAKTHLVKLNKESSVSN